MSKILLAVSALLIAAAAFFGFSTKGKVTELRQTNTTLTSSVNSEKAARTKADADRKAAEDQLAGATAQTDTLTKEAASSKAAADAALAQASQLQAQVAAKDQEIQKLNEQIAKTPTSATGDPIAEAPELTALQTQLRELQAQVAKSEEENRTLTARANDAEASAKSLRDQEARRQGKIAAKGLEGQVLAVNQGWSFVVLGIGDRQGVVPNSEMIVVRGGQPIAKVRVSSVEPSTSIADIVPGSIARGVRVQPGDRVIYPGGA